MQLKAGNTPEGEIGLYLKNVNGQEEELWVAEAQVKTFQ
jgi:hypothetical protein